MLTVPILSECTACGLPAKLATLYDIVQSHITSSSSDDERRLPGPGIPESEGAQCFMSASVSRTFGHSVLSGPTQ